MSSPMPEYAATSWSNRGEWIAIALILTAASHAVPSWWLVGELWGVHFSGPYLSRAVFHDLIALGFALIVVLPTYRRSGLCLGEIREHWKGVIVVCGLPVLATALVYPQLPERPFAGTHYSMWLISPLAQDLLFAGFLFGRFESSFPTYIHDRFRMKWCVPVTAALFALWHTPNFVTSMSSEYVLFQLCYTFSGFLLGGLSRQWTGSILYGVLSHMAVNYIAWSTS